MNLYL